jgi:uncharacterized membrane protein YkgB
MGYPVGYAAQHPIYDFTLNRPLFSKMYENNPESELNFQNGFVSRVFNK